jgi:CheY-like chemotaxis protein
MEEVKNPASSQSPLGARSFDDIAEQLSRRVVGQPEAVKLIVPYVYMFQAGLAPEGRPAGVFLLLGPTGTGKTKTVEAIADVLHGSVKNVLKVDCGEFQMEHEVAKLIGSPPGYLGHRETPPMLTQEALGSVKSPTCDLSLVLFDEIEKAAPSMTRLLLGILDKALLRLGDNTTVNFEKTLIFFTSNLGSREMMKEINPDIGFQAGVQRPRTDLVGKLESIALTAVKKRFSPEFVNRIDAVVTYQPLDTRSLELILDQHIDELQRHVNTRLGDRCFKLDISAQSRQFLLAKGTSDEYGARELKRTLHRHLTQPLATEVATGRVEPGGTVRVDLSENGESLVLNRPAGAAPAPIEPTVLIVDDNRDLLLFLERLLGQSGWRLLIAGSAEQAREIFARESPHVVLLDYMLGDDDGVVLAIEIQIKSPQTRVIMMTGAQMASEEEALCQKRSIPILRKPFLGDEVVRFVRERLNRPIVAASNPAGTN